MAVSPACLTHKVGEGLGFPGLCAGSKRVKIFQNAPFDVPRGGVEVCEVYQYMETPLSLPNRRSIIFTVDDDEDDIDLMRLLFRKAGIDLPVEIYRRGEDLMTALSGLLKKSVDAVMPLLCFLDIKMPGMNGHDVLRWIRQQREFDALSVVMLSSSEHPEDVRQAAEAGAQCYLAKYPQPAVLKRVVDEAERVAATVAQPSKEWFGLPANLLLRWGLMSSRS